MKRIFIDANVFLRFFTKDEKSHALRAKKLFNLAAKEEIKLVTGPPVLFEIAWTLRSSYKLSHEKILDVLTSILAIPYLEMMDEKYVEQAIALARDSSVDFADAYIAASTMFSHSQALATFNERDFKKLGARLFKF